MSTRDEAAARQPAPQPERRRGVASLPYVLLAHFFLEPWSAIDREAAAERAELGGAFDARAPFTLVVVALVVIFEQYCGGTAVFNRLFPAAAAAHWGALVGFAWWAGATVSGYLVVTLIALRLAGLRWRDSGFGIGDLSRHLRSYVLLYLAVLPLIVGASFTGAFQSTYPFYRLAGRSWFDLVAWEAMYGSTFVGVEAFFRGLMLFPLRRAFGSKALFVMAVPYCMVHFGKPPAEVVGAIFAGVLLGTLALRSRSIWGGVMLHVAVAWTMDLLALLQTSGWPGGGRFVGP